MTADMPDPVKVAREACAERAEEEAFPHYAERVRAGEEDTCPEVSGAILGARAMQDAMAGREVRVKALEWENDGGDAVARSRVGVYRVRIYAGLSDVFKAEGPGIDDSYHPSQSSAKAVLDSAYANAILSALEPAGAQEGAEECPYPINGKPLGTPASDCVAAGECGCVHGTTPAPDVPGLVERINNQRITISAHHHLVGATVRAFAEALVDTMAEAADALEALQAEVAAKTAEMKAVMGHIPMDYLRRHDTPGATGPTAALKLSSAMRDYAEDRWKLIDRVKASEARATAAEAERDAWRERESETQEALQKIGEEFGIHGGEPRVDGLLRVLREQRTDLAALKVEVERLRKADRACQWYWPENSTESENCADSPQEVVQNAYGWEEPRGDVVAVARGGVVEVTYCAALPPAPDSDSDDEFWVEEATKEAAAAKITAELERRAGLQPAKAGG